MSDGAMGDAAAGERRRSWRLVAVPETRENTCTAQLQRGVRLFVRSWFTITL
jgi:hypothetical protein